MKSIIPGNRLTALLLLACALLAAIVALEWHGFSQPTGVGTRSGEVAPQTGGGTALARTEFTAPDIKTFDEILERPLFREGRTPPPPPVVKATVVKNIVQKPRLTLEGVAISPEVRVAVVRDLGSNSLLQLREGMEHQGWRVEQVTRAGATLKNGEQTHELILAEDRQGANGKAPGGGRAARLTTSGARIAPQGSRPGKPVTIGTRQDAAAGAAADNGQGENDSVPASAAPKE